MIALTIFIQILGGPQVRFETHCYDRVLDSVGQRYVHFTLEMMLRASSKTDFKKSGVDMRNFYLVVLSADRVLENDLVLSE